MYGEPQDFWGKVAKKDEQIVAWHPLIDHCADVAACAAALLQRTLLRRRLARVGTLEDLSSGQISRLCVLVALHDVGKFNLGFQRKGNPRIPLEPKGHVREVLSLLDAVGSQAHGQLCDALDAEGIDDWAMDKQAGIEPLLLASICHHGRPIPPAQAGAFHASLWRPALGLDPFKGIAELRASALSWFPEARDAAPLPGSPAFQHAFCGLVMLADWLGSDTRFFPYSESRVTNRFSSSFDSACEALRQMGLNTSDARASLEDPASALARVLGDKEPRPLQRETLTVPCDSAGSLSILEAETGSGKTEAAFARYLSLFKQGLVDGLYFALPTRSAATQIYKRLCEAVVRAFPDPQSQPPVVLAVPGYLDADGKAGIRLAGFEVLWNDDPDRRFRYRGWAAEHPKRYLVGAVSVGTIDQVLLSALGVEHAHLRSTALLRQLLVIDEVHASDAYMTRILEEVLAHHIGAGGHALLMSATLGSALRERLLGAPPLPLAEAIQIRYPLLTHAPAGDHASHKPIDGGGRVKNVSVECVPLLEDPEAIASHALAAAAQGAAVLVLRNTVSACVATQRALLRQARERDLLDLCFACAGVPAPHHARFSTPDRTALDQAIEERLGKSRPSPAHARGCVAVTTQTVQQSLDLDADLLMSDLCPMDVLLQRIGRLHRHVRSRPPGFEKAQVMVLVPATRALHQAAPLKPNGEPRGPCGLGSVYADLRVLEATWQALEQHDILNIPDMNRALVESTTHPQALGATLSALGPRAERHVQWLQASYFADRLVAKRNILDWRQPFGECSFLSDELGERITTRLGEQDRRVRFEVPPMGPFGQELRELSIPAWLVRGSSRELLQETARIQEAASGRIVFTFDAKGQEPFLYDCLGLRPLSADPEEDLADA